MLHIIRPGTTYDFMGKARTFVGVSVVAVILSLLILLIKGPNFGLDFTGGHELLLEFAQPVSAEQVRASLEKLRLGESSVQRYEEAEGKTHYLVRVQRSQTFGQEEIAGVENAFKSKYGEHLKRVRYNPEAGDVVEVELASTATRAANVDTSTQALAGIVQQTNHDVRQVRNIGRADQLRFQIVLKGVDASVVNAMRQDLDPAARAVRVEFVGPTVGKQLRNDGILAMVYAMLAIMLYVALRFDFFYAPGAIIPLFHDALVTVGFLTILGEEFSLTTVAAVLTLIGFSVNDTIVNFDRIRETSGKVQGQALRDIVNRATNEMLGRTILTASTVLMSCVCLMIFGRGTVLFQFGLVMFVGCIFGAYSTIYVAAPVFIWFRENFGAKPVIEQRGSKGKKREVETVEAR
jgi:preprotein translocase subunit SecF